MVLVLGMQCAFAGVGSQQAKVAGSTVPMLPLDGQGVLDAKDLQQLSFRFKAGKNAGGKFSDGTFTVPYAGVTRMTYGDQKHLRVGQTIALTALAGVGGLLLLLSKSHTHFLTIDYKDEKSQDQMVSFEVGKDAMQPLIDALELRTGKKVTLETAPAATAPAAAAAPAAPAANAGQSTAASAAPVPAK